MLDDSVPPPIREINFLFGRKSHPLFPSSAAVSPRLRQWWEVTTPTLPSPGGSQRFEVQGWKDKHSCLSLTPSLFLFSDRKGTRTLLPGNPFSSGSRFPVVKGTAALNYTGGSSLSSPQRPTRLFRKTKQNADSQVPGKPSCLARRPPPPVSLEGKADSETSSRSGPAGLASSRPGCS